MGEDVWVVVVIFDDHDKNPIIGVFNTQSAANRCAGYYESEFEGVTVFCEKTHICTSMIEFLIKK